MRKKTLFIITLLTSALFISCSSGNKSTEIKEQPADSTIVGTDSWKEAQIRRFKKDSIIILNYDYKEIAKEDIPAMRASIKQLVEAINGGLEEYSQAEFYKNDRRVSIPLEFFKKEAQKVLDKAGPLYRKQFTKIMDKKLWEENITVEVSGKGNTILWFTAGRFANNKRIKEFQEAISSEVRTFGFKRTCYKWIKHDEEYTYYDL